MVDAENLLILCRYVSIDGQGHFCTIYVSGFVCFVLYKATISGERLQDHWSSGLNDDPGVTVTYFTARSNLVT